MSYIGGNTNPGNYIGSHPVIGIASSFPSFRNRIINGNLSNPIKQRGISTITGATGYTYDRWYYDGSTYLYQGIEDKNVNNGTYVISWEGSGINAAWKVSTDTTANNGPDATSGFSSVSNGGTFTVNEGTEYSKHLWIRFDGTLANLDKVMVEEGTVATPFEHRPISVELSLAQRYFQVIRSLGSAGARNSTDVEGNIQYLQEMRSTPSISLSAPYQVYDLYGNAKTQSSINVSIGVVGYNTSTGAAIGLSNFTGLTQGRIQWSGNGGNILLSAEL